MNSNDIIIIDNFLDNVDEIREDALSLEYTKYLPGSNGWKGYRCLQGNMPTIELHKKVEDVLSNLNLKFKDCQMRCYFHYTLDENNLDTNNTHMDYGFDYAGVLYLTPSPPQNGGTAFYNDEGVETYYLENIYNRLVIYPANEWHSLKKSFGDSIDNGRLTFTIFCKLKTKNTISLI
jgi:hypothetical protein